MKIRQAVEADVASIAQLQQEWFEEGSVYGFEPDSPDQIRSDLGPFYLVAEMNGEVVGFVSGALRTSEGLAVITAGECYLEVINAFVSPRFRQQGLGGHLVDELLHQAKSQGVTYALLYSATKDIRSVLKFYEQHGFQSWYIQMFREL